MPLRIFSLSSTDCCETVDKLLSSSHYNDEVWYLKPDQIAHPAYLLREVC